MQWAQLSNHTAVNLVHSLLHCLLLQGLGRSAEERLRSERLRAMERLDQKRQLLEVGLILCAATLLLTWELRNTAVQVPV